MSAHRVTDAHMHLPARPEWTCQDCGQPWPCVTKKTALIAEHRGGQTSLMIHLAFYLVDAIDDFGRPDRGPVPNLYLRFLGWIWQPTAGTDRPSPATLNDSLADVRLDDHRQASQATEDPPRRPPPGDS
jgi:hypothetical protein